MGGPIPAPGTPSGLQVSAPGWKWGRDYAPRFLFLPLPLAWGGGGGSEVNGELLFTQGIYASVVFFPAREFCDQEITKLR